MEVEYTPLYSEASLIMEAGQTTANTAWSALIHYGENKTLEPLFTMAVNLERDYRTSFADIITVTVTMGLGDYARLIYPNRLGLELTLTQTDFNEMGSEINLDGRIQSERYSAVLLDGPNSATVGQGAESNSREALNLSQIIDVHFQLFSKSVEQIRVMLTGGIYRKCNVEEVMKTVLTRQALDAKLPAETALVGIDMVPADNKDKKGQVVFAHGTKLIDVPDTLQKRIGVYNSGLGSYIQNKNWFIYPLYDTTDFKSRKKTVKILVMPKRKFANIERTFQANGDSLTILATGETSFKDDSGTNYVNSGNGVRFGDAKSIMQNPVTVADNKVRIKRTSNNSEFISEKNDAGVNFAALSAKRITDNPFFEYSHLAAKNGGIFKCHWENADPSLLIPGMTAKVTYMDGEDLKELYGIIHVVQLVSFRANGFANQRFINNVELTLFVNGQITPITE